MTISRMAQAVIEFDSNGNVSGATIDGRRYSNFPANTLAGPKSSSLVFQVELADHGTPSTLSAYTLHDHRGPTKKISVASHS